MRLLVIDSNDKVASIVEVPDDWPDVPNAWQLEPGHRGVVDETGARGVGDRLVNGSWVRPTITPDPAAAVDADAVAADDQLATLYDKFTAGTLTAADRGAIPDLAVRALGGRAKAAKLRGGG